MNKTFVNNFVKNAMSRAVSFKHKDLIMKEAARLQKLGIDNEESLKKFHYISQYVPAMIVTIAGKMDPTTVDNIIDTVYKQAKSISKTETKAIVSKLLPGIIVNAYPNDYFADVPIKGYDINKWKRAVAEFDIKKRLYGSREQAILIATKDWSDMDEVLDFRQWLKFYEEGGLTLYKAAAGVDTGNIYFPMEIEHLPGLSKQKEATPTRGPKVYNDQVESIRQKILGRINAAKRVLSSGYGRDFAGDNYDKLLDMMVELEKNILKLKTASMMIDVLYRATNSLTKAGVSDEYTSFIKKIAQELTPPMADPLAMPPMPGDVTSAPPITPVGDGEDPLKKFVEDHSKYLEEKRDTFSVENIKERFDAIWQNHQKRKTQKQASFNWANIETQELKKFEVIASNLASIIKNSGNQLVAIAQEVNPVPEQQAAPPPKDIGPPVDSVVDKGKAVTNVDKTMELALKNITITDVIDHLEALSHVFKNREIARQLSVIDLMLDKLGLAGFFPALAEATRSALESNQYCQSRVEDVLSKLISATNLKGESIIDSLHTKDNSIIDNEMKEYLTEEKKPKVEPVAAPEASVPPTPQPNAPPVPVAQPAAPVAPAAVVEPPPPMV